MEEGSYPENENISRQRMRSWMTGCEKEAAVLIQE